MQKINYDLITILGATATGKTNVAVALANKINGEIISADSRQVYKKMDIGTGKDILEYTINGKQIPYHLIDIVDAGYKYNVYEYQNDFLKSFQKIKENGSKAILCGGTGMYIDAVTKGYKLINVPVNNDLRFELEKLELSELQNILKTYKILHNNTDTSTKKRAIRAVEIANYYSKNKDLEFNYPQINNVFFGINLEREERRKRITERLKNRLKEGLVDEVNNLLKNGIKHTDLIYYGLEYKYITMYLMDEFSYPQMVNSLQTAIHQFAKRQMTWFRGMEKKGITINWIDGNLPIEAKIEIILEKISIKWTYYFEKTN